MNPKIFTFRWVSLLPLNGWWIASPQVGLNNDKHDCVGHGLKLVVTYHRTLKLPWQLPRHDDVVGRSFLRIPPLAQTLIQPCAVSGQGMGITGMMSMSTGMIMFARPDSRSIKARNCHTELLGVGQNLVAISRLSLRP